MKIKTYDLCGRNYRLFTSETKESYIMSNGGSTWDRLRRVILRGCMAICKTFKGQRI